MSQKIRCKCCGRLVSGNPRINNQQYCNDKDCQRARKAGWQRKKMASDKAYQLDQRDRQRRWRQAHPDYYREYRKRNSDYTDRNRKQQRQRDRAKNRGDLAKMDASISKADSNLQPHYLQPHLAKMDTSDSGKPCSIIEIEEFVLPDHLAKMDTKVRNFILIPVS